MTLTFTKQGTKYVAEFTATSDFNLHIEKTGGGKVTFFQRSTPNGEYAPINDVKFYPFDFYFDTDFIAFGISKIYQD